MSSQETRRSVLVKADGILAATSLSTNAPAQGIIEKAKEAVGIKAPEVTPPEDLMREHGVLDRVLLIYEAAMQRFSRNEDFDPKVITDSAQVIRDFIENYHEQSEERFLFPRFRSANQLVQLVDILDRQHKAGRRVTELVFKFAPQSQQDGDARRQTIGAMQAFITMYRPHAAREDTELFPRLRTIVSGHEFDSIAEEMEKQEKQKFGDDGFEKMASHVADIERSIGLNDLDQFTPH